MSDILRKRAVMPSNPTSSRDVNRYGVAQPGVTSPSRDNIDITLSTSGSDIAKCDSRNSLASRGSDTFHTARTFEVATERGGRKLMSEEEVSSLVHNALRRARQATGQAPISSASSSPRHRTRQNPLSPRSLTASSTITSPRPPTSTFKGSNILLPNEGELHLDTSFPRQRGSQVELPARYNRTTGPYTYDLAHATIADNVSNISVDASDFPPHALSESPSDDSANDDTKINSVNSSEAIIRRVEEEIANARRAAQEANRRLAGVSANFRFGGMHETVLPSSTNGTEIELHGDDPFHDRNLPARPQPSDGSDGPSLTHNDSEFQGSRYDSIGNVTSHDLDNDDFCHDLSFPSDRSTEIELSRSVEPVESTRSVNSSEREDAMLEDALSEVMVKDVVHEDQEVQTIKSEAVDEIMMLENEVEAQDSTPDLIHLESESVDKERYVAPPSQKSFDEAPSDSSTQPVEEYQPVSKQMKPNSAKPKSYSEFPPEFSAQGNIIMRLLAKTEEESRPETRTPETTAHEPPIEEGSCHSCHEVIDLTRVGTEGTRSTEEPEVIEAVESTPGLSYKDSEERDTVGTKTSGLSHKDSVPGETIGTNPSGLSYKDSEERDTIGTKTSGLSHKDSVADETIGANPSGLNHTHSVDCDTIGTKPSGLSHKDSVAGETMGANPSGLNQKHSVDFETIGTKHSGLSHKGSVESSHESPLEYQAPYEEVQNQTSTLQAQDAEDDSMRNAPPPLPIERTRTIEINEHGIAVSVRTQDDDDDDFHQLEEVSEHEPSGKSYEIIEPVSTEASTQAPVEVIQEMPTFDLPRNEPILVDENGDVEVLPSKSQEERIAALEIVHTDDGMTTDSDLGDDTADSAFPRSDTADVGSSYDNEQTAHDENEMLTTDPVDIIDDAVGSSDVKDNLTAFEDNEKLVDNSEQTETNHLIEQEAMDANFCDAPDVVQFESDEDVFADVDTLNGTDTTENEVIEVSNSANAEASGAQEDVGVVDSHDHESDAVTHIITNKSESLESEDDMDVNSDEISPEIEKADENPNREGPEANSKKYWWVSEENTVPTPVVSEYEASSNHPEKLEQVESQGVHGSRKEARLQGCLDSVSSSRDLRPGESDDATLRQGYESRMNAVQLKTVDSGKPAMTAQQVQADTKPDTIQSKNATISIPQQVVTSVAVDHLDFIPTKPDPTLDANQQEIESSTDAFQLNDNIQSTTTAVQIKPTKQDGAQPEIEPTATATKGTTKVRFKQRYPVPPLISKPRSADDISRDNRVPHVGSSPFLSKPKPDLRQLLQAAVGSSLQRRSNACGALKVLTKMKKNQLTLVRTAGFLDALVFAASTKSSKQDLESSRDARTRAVAAICNVSEPKDNREIVFCHPGLVMALIQTIKEDKAEARMEACGAIALLAKTPSNREPLAQTTNLLDVLATLLMGRKGANNGRNASYSVDDAESGTQSFSSDSESSSSASIEMESSVSRDDDEITLPTVASMRELNKSKLSETNKRAKMNACAALLHISKQCGATPIMCRNVLLMDAIVAVSQNINDPLNSKCLEILCNLSRFPANNEMMAHYPGLVESLVANGGSSSSLNRTWSLRVLQNLSTQSAGKTVLANRIVLEMLSFSIMRDNLDEQLAAIATLYNLSTEPGAVVPLTNTKNVVATLVHVAHNPESVSEVRLMACDALATLGLWLQTLAGAGTIPKEIDENVTLPTYVTSGWERWE